MTRTVAIIQARMGSSRLPGKVLLDLSGEPMLNRVVNRVRRSRFLDEVVVATSTKPRDDVIVNACDRLKVAAYRGSEQDVLDRYYQTMRKFEADAVARITADCPFIDPGIIDQAASIFMQGGLDCVTNTWKRTYPRGLDVAILGSKALARNWQEASEPHQRTHVTPYVYEATDSFRIKSVSLERDYSHYRWTVDTAQDLEFVRRVYRQFGGRDDFSWREVLDLVQSNPALSRVNREIRQKEQKEC